MTEKVTISTNQRRALDALLTCPSVRKAAKKAELSERTLYRYLNNATFKAELRARQSQILAATTSALVGLSGDAVGVLKDLLKDSDLSDSVKVRAVQVALDQTQKAIDANVILERIERLEVLYEKQRTG